MKLGSVDDPSRRSTPLANWSEKSERLHEATLSDRVTLS